MQIVSYEEMRGKSKKSSAEMFIQQATLNSALYK